MNFRFTAIIAGIGLLTACQSTDVAVKPMPTQCMVDFENPEYEPVGSALFRDAVKIAPSYPYGAMVNRVQGCVRLAFDIAEDGKTSNIRVLGGWPEGVFDNSAKESLALWLFNSKKAQKDLKVQLEYAF